MAESYRRGPAGAIRVADAAEGAAPDPRRLVAVGATSLLSSDALVRWDSRGDQFASMASLSLDVPGMQSIVMGMGVPGVVRADSALVVWYPVLGLTKYRLDGSSGERVEVPRVRRRGEGTERIAKQMELRRAGSDSTLFSATLGIGGLSTGELVLAALDARRTRAEGNTLRESDIRVYLTLVDPSLRRVCADGLVPLVTDALSIIVMHDGDPHFLTRTVTDDGRVRSVMYRYRVDLAKCAWVPVGVD